MSLFSQDRYHFRPSSFIGNQLKEQGGAHGQTSLVFFTKTVLRLQGFGANYLVLDVREHACCLDDKNLRAKFVEAFWSLVSWEEANRRFTALLKGVTM